MTEQDFFDIDTTLLSVKPDSTTRYLQFFLSEHPLSGQNGMVNFARHAASKKIGRWLTPNEVVVHSDGDRENWLFRMNDLVRVADQDLSAQHRALPNTRAPVSVSGVSCRISRWLCR